MAVRAGSNADLPEGSSAVGVDRARTVGLRAEDSVGGRAETTGTRTSARAGAPVASEPPRHGRPGGMALIPVQSGEWVPGTHPDDRAL